MNAITQKNKRSRKTEIEETYNTAWCITLQYEHRDLLRISQTILCSLACTHLKTDACKLDQILLFYGEIKFSKKHVQNVIIKFRLNCFTHYIIFDSHK